MFSLWHRGATEVVSPRPKSRRRRLRFGCGFPLCTERLEDRLAPAATLNLPASGFTGATGTTVMNFPIGISALSDGAGHVGLASATLAVTYPTGVFSFPTGTGLATPDVSLGTIPLSDTAGAGGAGDWNLTANSPTDGQLDITLTAKNGDKITTNTFPSGGTLVTVNFPILASATPGNETISVVSVSGNVHTQVLGGGSGSQTYILSGLPASGTIVVTAGVQNPPTVPATESYSTEANQLLTQAAPGLLTGASDPQNEALSVGTVNGSAANLGGPLTLASGATLTVQAKGSFVYTPAADFVGSDSFTFQAIDTGGSLSNTGTVTIEVVPTLSMVPKTISGGPAGTEIEEDIYLDNPDPAGGVGPLTAFNLAITYDSTALATAGDGSGIHPGALLPADLLQNFLANVSAPGVIGMGTFGTGTGADLVTGPAPLELVSIDFSIVGKTTESTPIELVSAAQDGGVQIITTLTGAGGMFPINPHIGPEGSAYVPGVDTLVSIKGATPLTLTPAALPDGDFNAAYDQTITASGGTAPYTFVLLSGALPPGLTLDGSSGVIAGTATAAGSSSFTIRATDGDGIQGVQNYTLTIMSEVSITTSTLATWTAANPGYSQTFAVLGGVAPFTFAAISGTLPPGLTLSSAGMLSGTPSAAGTYTFTVTASDSTSASGSQIYTVTINPAVAILTATLPNVIPGTAYSQTVAATGGTGLLTFTSSGTLPPGLTLSSTGVLSGMATTEGSFTFAVTATDTVSASASQSYSVIVNPIMITTATLPPWTMNVAGYAQIISATGGISPLTFSESGTLPPGLTLNSEGSLFGTPASVGSFSLTVTATDSIGVSASQNYTVVINPQVTIATTALAAWTVNQPGYSQTINASGGTGLLTFSVTSILPLGLSLSSAGVLSGTPTAATSFTFIVNATDTVGFSASQTYTVTINPPLTISTDSLANWTVTQPGYSHTIQTVGGTGAVSFTSTGTLPPGVTLNTTGVLAGTPTTIGTFTFTVTGTDTTGAMSGAQSYVMTINPRPQLELSGPGPNWPINLPGFLYTVAAVNGTGALTFSATGTLPPGLKLSSGGVISGTPTAIGSYTFTVTASDSTKASDSGNLTLTINPAVNPFSLSNWTVDLPGYSQLITLGGGIAPFTFGTTGTLPLGLTLGSNGMLAGTPTATGSYTFAVTVTDSISQTATQNYAVVVNPALAITTASLANWPVGQPGYMQQIVTSGGTGSVTFSLSGSLPPGLTFGSSGSVSGKPTTIGAFTFMVTATDSVGARTAQSFTVVIDTSVVTIATTSLPAWTVGISYSQPIEAKGGAGSYTFTTSGNLPPGLQLSNAGILFGTPTTVGMYTFVVIASDSLGVTASAHFTVTINPSPQLHLTGTGLSWIIDQPGFKYVLAAAGGTGSLTFSATGTLPPGLSLSNAGVLSGTPTAKGAYTFTVTVTDSAGATSSGELTINILQAVVPTSLPNWAANEPDYNQTISLAGGVAPVTVSVTGTLPAGLSLSTTGVLSGTPTTAGSYTFTLTATDAAGTSASQSYTVFIFAFGPSALASWTVNQPGYSQTITAGGGSGPYTFSASATLPPGLTLSSSGVLSGTPTMVGVYGFVVTATDSAGASVSETYTVTINPGLVLSRELTTLASFNGTNGAYPYGNLIEDSSGNLIGTADGGVPGYGTVFELPQGGSSVVTLASFNGDNGDFPVGGVIEDSSGNLFGTTQQDGKYGYGTVYEIVHGSGSVTTLANFNYDNGASPSGGLVEDSSGNLYGSTSGGGDTAGDGTVFEVARGSGTITTLATFTGDNGASPNGPLVLDSAGNLFGTTNRRMPLAGGTVFEIVKGSGVVTTLATFDDTDGLYLQSGLLQDPSGNLFGTTYSTVFELVHGSNTITTLASFDVVNAGYVSGGLIEDSSGELFGVTGSQGYGTLFELIPGTDTLITVANFYGTISTDPVGSLVEDGSGNLFGATDFGGPFGTLFEVSGHLPGWTVNQPGYGQTILAMTGTGPFNYTVTAGTLPPGLSLSSTGILAGTPTTVGSFAFTVTATDSTGATGSQQYSVVINPPVVMDTTSLASGTTGTAYSQTFGASGGTGSFTFTTTGLLPNGLTLSSSGVLSGTPTTAGVYNFTVTATDAAGASASQSYTVFIFGLSPSVLANWTVNQPGYSQTIMAAGGSGPYTFSASGTFPPGLTLSSSGVLSGTPTAVGVYAFVVTATDSTGVSGSANYTVTINPPLALSKALTTLASFNNVNGAHPNGSLIEDSNGDLFGTTESGGAFQYYGTVFELPRGSDTVIALDSFNNDNGANPNGGLLEDSSGNLFGTASLDGARPGNIFEIVHGTSTIINLASFDGWTQGGNPEGALVEDSNGDLFGTASSGGAAGDGTVFELAQGSHTITPLVTFNGPNGSWPNDSLVIDSNGNLFGTTFMGGPGGGPGDGTVFEVPRGSGVAQTLASFDGIHGGEPRAGLIEDLSGVFFGTTSTEGPAGFGTVYEESGNTLTTLASFGFHNGVYDGLYPGNLIEDSKGNLFGLASEGGLGDAGTLFEVAHGSHTLTILASFYNNNTSDPLGSLLEDSNGNLFGATAQGGTWGYGTLFELSGNLPGWTVNQSSYNYSISTVGGTGPFAYIVTSGTLPLGISLSTAGVLAGTPTAVGSYTFTVTSTDSTGASGSQSYTVVINSPVVIDTTSLPGGIISTYYHKTLSASGGTGSLTFSATGSVPAGLTLSSSGALAGTPTAAGSYTFTVTATDGVGASASQTYTIVTVIPNPVFSPVFLTLARFNDINGSSPLTGLVEGSSGNLFGSTNGGGLYGDGTLFEVPVGSGRATTLATFDGIHGANPSGDLAKDSNGNFFGTTVFGGTLGYGTVFEVLDGSDSVITVASFNDINGAYPMSGLVLDSSGDLFGTTEDGGTSSYGTVFEIVGGSSTITTLVSFDDSNGANPIGGLIVDSSGNLFGTTSMGGMYGEGTVFELVRGSSGYTLDSLVAFRGPDGDDPQSRLIEDSSSNLFGTTVSGGSDYYAPHAAGSGTVFEVRQGSSTITTLASFSGTDTGHPHDGVLEDSSGNLFGTGSAGAASNSGTIYEIIQGTGNITTLVDLDHSNAFPQGGLLEDSSGNIFSTSSGGAFSQGSVFEWGRVLRGWPVSQPGYNQTLVATGGSGTLTYAVTSGTLPPGLSLSGAGVLAGKPTAAGSYTFLVTATDSGGRAGNQSYTAVINQPVAMATLPPANGPLGSAYSQTLGASGGTGSLTFSATGALPAGLTLSTTGVLSGTPLVGGGRFTFSVTATDNTGASGSQSYTVFIFAFSPSALPGWSVNRPGYNQTITASGGEGPYIFSTTGTLPPGLTLSSSGVISGVPTSVGSFTFLVTATDSAGAAADESYTLTVNAPPVLMIGLTTLGVFTQNNGFNPDSNLIEDSNGNLFGTTNGSGTNLYGTVFEIPAGSGAAMTLANFSNNTGYNPSGNLVEDANGDFFGTTEGGGANNEGTVFELARGSGTITVFASFDGNNGAEPIGGLVKDNNGDLFGTAVSGGLFNDGTVFEIAGGTHTLTALANFDGTNGAFPQGNLIRDSSGNLFGTTTAGGPDGGGTVFELKNGSDLITTLATFGAYVAPYAGLVEDTSGDLFGTTRYGGIFGSGMSSMGSVFELIQGSNSVTTLASFDGADGAHPIGGLVEDSQGNLFGTTSQGGLYGRGTVFDVANGSGTISTLVNFNIANGDYPASNLTLDSHGNIFGATVWGGAISGGAGTVFELTSTLPGWTANQSVYNQTVFASGGTGFLTYSLTGGALPSGLSLSSTGLLWGTPTAAGNFSFTITATDSLGASGSRSYTMVIAPGPANSPIYVDPTFNGASGSDPTTDPGLHLNTGVNAFSTINAALAHLASDGALVIFGGTYSESSVNFNVPLAVVDVATNPSDPADGGTVTINGAVTLSNDTVFEMESVLTGTGTSTAADLTFGSTVNGPGVMIVNGNATLTFDGPLSTALTVLGGQLNATATLTLTGSSTLTLGPGLSETIGALASTSSTLVQLDSGSGLTTGGGGSSTFSGSITGPGQLTKVGMSTFTLSGYNTYTGPTFINQGTLTINWPGSLGQASNSVALTSPTSVLDGNGSVARPVVITSTASGAMIGGSLTVSNPGGVAVDVDAGANNASVNGLTITGSSVGILVEPGSGNDESITDNTLTGNLVGLEVLNGVVTATGNIIGAVGAGNNVGVYLPAVNPNDPALPVDPLLTLEGNQILGNTTALQNATTMGVTAILNWWGSTAGPVAGQVVGVPVDDYTPYALDATSAGPNPTTFDFFKGTGSDGNVYITGTLGADTINASVDPVNTNLIHVTGTVHGDYLRGGPGNRLIIYSFGDNVGGTRDVITVSGNWDAEIHAEPLAYQEPLTFSGLSSSTITTIGSGSDVIFGGGNDIINADTSANNVLVAGLSTGRTGAPTALQLSGGSGANLYIAGSVDETLAPLAPSGRLDYDTLRSMDDLWASGLGGAADAMSAAALFSVANTPGAILTGSARATILPGSGKSWFIAKGAGNPVNTPTGTNADYIAGSTASPNYRQAIQ